MAESYHFLLESPAWVLLKEPDVKEALHLPGDVDGRAWPHIYRGRLHPRHHHEELEFNLVVRGTGRYLLDDRRYDLGPNSLVWLFPEQEHVLIDMSKDFSMWILVVSPRTLRAHCAAAPYSALLEGNPPGHFCRRLTDPDALQLRRLLEGLPAAEHDRARANAGIAYTTLAGWAMYDRAPDTIASVRLHPAVERAASLLSRDDAADLGAVAAKAGLSHSRLSHLFREQTGQTLAAYRNRQRLERFFDAASDRKRTLLAAALDAGFGSYAQFHRIFRSLVGVSPATWQRRADGERG